MNNAGYRAFSVNRTNVKLWNINFYSGDTPVVEMCPGDITIKGTLENGASGSIAVCRYDKDGTLKFSKILECDAQNGIEYTITDCCETDKIKVYFWSNMGSLFPKAIEKTL